MPVYNSENYLKEAISSVLNQTVQNFELIIINDGSTDKSEEIIQSFNDSRIKYYSQSKQGVAAARNKGLELSEGEYIVFQDSDDISLPIRFERLMGSFHSDNIGIVHSDVLLIDDIGTAIGYWLAHNIDRTRLLRFFIKIGSPISGATMMIKREAIINRRYDVSLTIGEDDIMIYEILNEWDAVHVPEPLYLYRKHSANTTKTQMNSLHIMKLVNAHTVEQLVPEIEWDRNDSSENEIIACGIIATFLFRRGAIKTAQELMSNTLLASEGTNAQQFIIALTRLILGKYNDALEFLFAYKEKNHIINNYIGESLAYSGKMIEAQKYFMKALYGKPDYIEPMDNLKSLGGLKKMNILDRSWLKFSNSL